MTPPALPRASTNGSGEDRQRVCQFLSSIGIEVEPKSGVSGFLSSCQIVHGVLLIDSDCPVSNILHEAGHIATVPAIFRHLLEDNVDKMWDGVFRKYPKLRNIHPDHPLNRAITQCSDPEATAWAWAAGKAIGLADQIIIQDHEYPDPDGSPGGEDVRFCLSMGAYAGINGLHHAGMCHMPANSLRKTVGYPALLKWTQDADFHTPAPSYVTLTHV